MAGPPGKITGNDGPGAKEVGTKEGPASITVHYGPQNYQPRLGNLLGPPGEHEPNPWFNPDLPEISEP